jgi:hypothetical protein
LFDASESETIEIVPPTIPIALLDTTTLKWSVPQLDNPKVPNVAGHSATSTHVNMLVAFGKLIYL